MVHLFKAYIWSYLGIPGRVPIDIRMSSRKNPGKRDPFSLPMKKITGVSKFDPGPTKYKLKEKVSDL